MQALREGGVRLRPMQGVISPATFVPAAAILSFSLCHRGLHWIFLACCTGPGPIVQGTARAATMVDPS